MAGWGRGGLGMGERVVGRGRAGGIGGDLFELAVEVELQEGVACEAACGLVEVWYGCQTARIAEETERIWRRERE